MEVQQTGRVIDVAGVVDQRGLGSHNLRVIGLSWLITAFDGLDQLLFGFTVPYIEEQLHLGFEKIGYVSSATMAGMVLGGFVATWFADRIGRRPAIVWTSFAFGLLTLATAWADSYGTLLGLRFLTGIATGGMLPLAWALNIEFVPRRLRATVVTIIMVGYSLGGALAAPLTNAIAPAHGWQAVYLLAGIATVACAAALLLWLPESIRFLALRGQRGQQLARSVNRLDPSVAASATDRFVVGDEVAEAAGPVPLARIFAGRLRYITPLLWMGYFSSTTAAFYGATWGPSVLELMHVPRQTAALLPAFASLSGAALGLVLMRFTDRLGPRAIALFPTLALPLMLAIGFGWVPPAALLPAAAIAAMLVTVEHFGMHSIAGIYYPLGIRARGGGVATSVAKLGAIVGPIAIGHALGAGMPAMRAYALLALCPALTLASVLGIAAVLRAPATIATAARPHAS